MRTAKNAFATHGTVDLLVFEGMTLGNDLHIVVFTDTFFETNGVGTYYKTLIGWSRTQKDLRVTVICPERDDLGRGDYPEDTIPVRGRFQFRNPFYKDLVLGYFSESKLASIVRSLPGRKVGHVATSGALGVSGANTVRKLGLPLIGWYNTDLDHYARVYGRSVLGRPGEWLAAKGARICDKLAYGHCNMLGVPSDTAAQTISQFYSGRITVLPYPIDVSRFQPHGSRLGPFRKKYARNGLVLVAVVGRVAKEKNLDLICKLLGGDDRIRLVFVGDGPYAKTLQKRWNANVTGFLIGNDLVEAYQQSDVLVQLSMSETFGLTLIEAMSCGLPPIVLRSQGLAACFTGDSGVEVLELEDLSTLADRCVRLVGDKDEHRRRSLEARVFAERFSPDTILPSFVSLHRGALASAVKAPPALLQEAESRRADLIAGLDGAKEKTSVH